MTQVRKTLPKSNDHLAQAPIFKDFFVIKKYHVLKAYSFILSKDV